MKRIRCFVALNLPIDAVREIAEIQADLRQAADAQGAKVNWVPPPNLHVTLKFLGDIAKETAVAFGARLSDRLADRPALDLRTGGIGAFPGTARPRVVWIKITDDQGALEGLAQDVEGWADEFGFPRDSRSFQGHVTLGRVKEGGANLLAAWQQPNPIDCAAREIVLYRSDLHRHGAEYAPLTRIALG